jgi:hypothetical protein
MGTTVRISEIRDAGIRLSTDEAVAIAQQLIHQATTPLADPAVASDGSQPSLQKIYLDRDGCVHCPGYETTPAVSEVALLLQLLLSGAGPVPGGLKYVIARALLEVDVAPFDSLEEFSTALARFERSDRGALIRRVVDRCEDAARAATLPFPAAIDRRRSALTSDLRRHLREADAQLYRHHVASANAALVPRRPRWSRLRVKPVFAASAAAGLTLIAAGELMHRGQVESWRPIPIAAVPPAAPPAIPEPATVSSLRAVPATFAVSAASASEGSKVAIRTVRRTGPTQKPIAHKRARQKGRGLFEKLRLQWLKNAFTAHSDQL